MAISPLASHETSTRPLFSVYEGADAYFAFHTNCCESSGTSTYTWYPEMWVGEAYWTRGFAETGLPPGTYDWSDRIHRSIIATIQPLPRSFIAGATARMA